MPPLPALTKTVFVIFALPDIGATEAPLTLLKGIAEAIAQSDAFSIAGGGDTLAAVDKYEIADKISYISTGGGAFLEFLEGKTLPAVAVLEEKNQ